MTTDADVFDFSADSHQLFSPGGEVFDSFFVDSTPEASDGRRVAWLLQCSAGSRKFVVATRFGLRHVETFEELLAALDTVGPPTDFPFGDWPGMTVSVIA